MSPVLDIGHGGSVHYVDDGDPAAPPLLLLHGNPTSSFLYRKVVDGLRDRFRCIAPDLPGFGASAAPDGYGYTPVEHAAVLERLVVELDLRDVTMMVQDWGGPIGFAVAGRHPERFSRFVVGNTWAWPMADPATWAFSKLLGGPVGKALILHRNLFVERIMPLATRRDVLDDEVMDVYRAPFRTAESRVPTWVFPREITGSAAFLRAVEADLARLRDRPALIIWPEDDPAFGRPHIRERWEAVFPDHRVVPLVGVGHYIQEEAPEEIVEAIRAWAT